MSSWHFSGVNFANCNLQTANRFPYLCALFYNYDKCK